MKTRTKLLPEPQTGYTKAKKPEPAARKSTFKVIYVIQRGKSNSEGLAPILARITVNSDRVHFATRTFIDPVRWLPKDYRTIGRSREEKQINEMLEELRVLIRRKYDEMLLRGEVITAGKLKNALTGFDERSMKLLELCDWFIEDYRSLLKTKQCCRETWLRYQLARTRLAEFMAQKCKLRDIPLADINPKFVADFFKWLRVTYSLTNNSSMKLMRQLKTMYRIGITNGWAKNDPFGAFKIHFDKVDRGYLTSAELERLQNKAFPTRRLEVIRDLFLFSCFTGLAYIDLKLLSQNMIQVRPDGKRWICTKRQKTNVPVHVRLLEVPEHLIEKYEGKAKAKLLFPVPSNQKVNTYLKEIAGVCGIDKYLTFHMARHTFATTVTLANGVPIETISKMLGHTNIQTTQVYARIIDQKIDNDMEALDLKLRSRIPATGVQNGATV